MEEKAIKLIAIFAAVLVLGILLVMILAPQEEGVVVVAGEARARATNWECIDRDLNDSAYTTKSSSYLYKFKGKNAGITKGTVNDVCHSTRDYIVREAICKTKVIDGKTYVVSARQNYNCRKLGSDFYCQNNRCVQDPGIIVSNNSVCADASFWTIEEYESDDPYLMKTSPDFIKGVENVSSGMEDNCYNPLILNEVAVRTGNCDGKTGVIALYQAINCQQELGSGWRCTDGACKKLSGVGPCEDTDEPNAAFYPLGLDTRTAGTTSEDNISWADTCTNSSYLEEYYCNQDGALSVKGIACRCSNGACI